MSRLLPVIGIIVLLAFAALLVGLTVPFATGIERRSTQLEALPYAVSGLHPVGTQDLVIDREAPLDATIWYPAQEGEPGEAPISYPYKIKMGPPLGAVTIATFSGRAARGARFDLASGPYPLVILSPGLSIGTLSYAWLAEHLASYGFVVIAPEHVEHFDGELNMLWQAAVARPADILDVLTFVGERAGTGEAMEGLVDLNSVAVIGHSYGGYTSLAAGGARIDTAGFTSRCKTAEAGDPGIWLCDETLPHIADMARLAGLDAVPDGLWPSWSDSRVGAVVSMAGDAYMFGRRGLAEITAPVMAIGGTSDEDTPYLWGTHPTFEHVSSSSKARVALENAGHMIFSAPCESIPLLVRLMSAEFCSDTGWDRYRAHNLIAHFATAFLLAELKQDMGAKASLAPVNVDFPGVTYAAQGY